MTQQIRPQIWLNKVDVEDEMFKLYIKKMDLIEQYGNSIKRLENYNATLSILLNLINEKEFRM